MATIKDLAASTRRRGIEHYGKASFARQCMDFERQLPEHSLNSLFRLLVKFNDNDGKTMQFAFCWLDGNGYGDKPVEWLGQELAKARQKLNKKQFENPKEYQKWYYENVTRLKRDRLKPEVAARRTTRKKPGEKLIHICAFPVCGKEFVARSSKHLHCSISCGVKHGYDLKKGITRNPGELFCPGCKQLYPASEFPINTARTSGRSAYCLRCHNENTRINNARLIKKTLRDLRKLTAGIIKKRNRLVGDKTNEGILWGHPRWQPR